MTKRRRLTTIRVRDDTSFNLDGGSSADIFSNLTPGEEHNMNSSVANGGDNTRNVVSEVIETLHSNEDNPNETDTDTAERSVRRRGPTILTDIWNQPPDMRTVVDFNKEGQPYGVGSTVLSSFIGTMGRNPELAPQGYSDWRLVPEEYKVKCMTEIKLRFIFPRRGEDHILKALGRVVKEFRGELKAMYYEPNKQNRSNLVNAKPSRVPMDQWLKLISYWDQDKTKRRATINRINQKNQTMPHCAGRQSFAQLRAKKTVNGIEPSRAQIFIATHKDRKTREKKKIDERSAKAVELMKEKLQELPNGIEQLDGKIAWKGDIFDQVIGKEERRGRVRGVGGDLCASKLWANSGVQPSSDFMENNVASNELINKLRDEMNLMQQKHTEELKMVQEKSDAEVNKVLEKQNQLENLIHDLLVLFKGRKAQYSKYDQTNTDDYSNSSG